MLGNSSIVHPQAQHLIATLQLSPHPEGGWYREEYRSPQRVTTPHGTVRAALTTIHFLLTAEVFSAFHRLASDEIWHFYRGDGITIDVIDAGGALSSHRLGPQGPWQLAIGAGTNFASHVDVPGGYALVGCDVAPGFDFEDFCLTARAELIATHPQHAALIERYTR